MAAVEVPSDLHFAVTLHDCQRLQVELTAGVYEGHPIFSISPEHVSLRSITPCGLRVMEGFTIQGEVGEGETGVCVFVHGCVCAQLSHSWEARVPQRQPHVALSVLALQSRCYLSIGRSCGTRGVGRQGAADQVDLAQAGCDVCLSEPVSPKSSAIT